MKALCVSMGVLLAAIAVATALSPSLGIVLVPASCFLTCVLAVSVGAWVAAAPAAAFAVAAACVPGGKMLLASAAAVHAALAVVIPFRGKLRSTWAQIAIAASVCAVAVTATVGVFALVRGVTLAECIALECESLSRDGYALMLADKLYEGSLTVRDELYVSEILRDFGTFVFRETDDGALWYLTGFGAFTGGLGSLALVRRKCTLSELRLGRTYLAAVAAPALVFALFGFYEPMAPVVRTVVNLMITMPCALCGVTLLYHSFARVRGKPKIVAWIAFGLIMTAAVLFWEWGLLILGFVGLADCVLDVRKLLDWALE